ncbi:MAG: hypothetical protein LAP86_14745 [Acidobacteriia bacterium]|nr:hypothetical protein [Terriglobia bacterium]
MKSTQDKEAKKASRDSTKKADHADSPISLTSTPKPQLEPPKTHCEVTCKTEKNWWDKTKPWVEMLGAFVLIVYTFYTAKMYCANRDAATAATNAANTAKDTLNISERAYVIFGTPEIDYEKKIMNIPVVNTGHVVSGQVDITLYEGTFNNDSRSHEPIPFKNLVERHRSIQSLESIAAGRLPSIFAVPLPRMDPQKVKDARQMVMVVGSISYNDGFPNTPTQHWTMCVHTVYQSIAKQTYLSICNGGVLLPKFEALPDWEKFTEPQTD